VAFHDDALPLSHGGAACLYQLQDAARNAGEVYVYIGDDGRVYHDGGFTPPAPTLDSVKMAEVRS
jgi:hypothetical protein